MQQHKQQPKRAGGVLKAGRVLPTWRERPNPWKPAVQRKPIVVQPATMFDRFGLKLAGLTWVAVVLVAVGLPVAVAGVFALGSLAAVKLADVTAK
jgi:hypothetical protein